MDQEGADAEPGRPTQFQIDLAAGTVKVEQLDDMGGDFTRINDAYCGVRTRYHYMAAFQGAAMSVGAFDSVVKYDLAVGTRTAWYAGPHALVGEAVFAPDPSGSAEDDGWLLSCVYDLAEDTTDLVILDARDVAAGPVARVHAPRRIPFGFHANWFAAPA